MVALRALARPGLADLAMAMLGVGAGAGAGGGGLLDLACPPPECITPKQQQCATCRPRQPWGRKRESASSSTGVGSPSPYTTWQAYAESLMRLVDREALAMSCAVAQSVECSKCSPGRHGDGGARVSGCCLVSGVSSQGCWPWTSVIICKRSIKYKYIHPCYGVCPPTCWAM